MVPSALGLLSVMSIFSGLDRAAEMQNAKGERVSDGE
jgi:hypothetical protein